MWMFLDILGWVLLGSPHKEDPRKVAIGKHLFREKTVCSANRVQLGAP